MDKEPNLIGAARAGGVGTGNETLSRNDFFINRVSGKFIVSSVIAMVFLYVGALIDTLLVGAFRGETGLSAMSLVSPVYLIFYTVGATVAIGGSVVASRVLGKENSKDYCRVFTHTTVILAVVATVMLTVGYLFLDPIASLLSGDAGVEETHMVREYLAFYLPGGAANLLAYVSLYFLKTDGRPKVSSRLFSFSALLNAALTWLFMSPVFDMGVAGAGLATSVSMVSVAVLGFLCLLKGNRQLRFLGGKLQSTSVREILRAGVPNGLSNLLESARILTVNFLILSIGQAALLPCYTVVRNVSDLLAAVMVGVSSALMPLIGQFFGESDFDSERMVLKHSEKVGFWITLPMMIAVCALSVPLFRLFGVTDATVLEEGKRALPLACIGGIAAYFNTLYIGYLTAVRREGLATVLVVSRLLGWLCAVAIPLAYSVGIWGIWLSFSIAELLTLLTYYAACGVIRHRHPTLDRFLIDTGKEHHADIVFSVKNDLSEIASSAERISAFCEEQDISVKQSMKVGLALEEVLTFLISHGVGTEHEEYIDVRVCKLNEEVMIRFRYLNAKIDPMSFYNDHSNNEEMEEELLGIKMIVKSASFSDFRQTLGASNLMLIF